MQVMGFIIGITGAYLVVACGPRSVFLTQAVAGVFTLVVAMMMSPALEIEGDIEAEALV